jgi:hypothetical protein
MPSAAVLEAAEYEWEVVDPLDTLPPETTIERAPGPADLSSTIFEFSGVDDLTPSFLLTYECQVTNGTPETAPPNGAAWEQCFSPFNLLDLYTYADPEMLLTQHTFWVRAVDAVEPEIVDPTQAQFEGNPDPTPASHTWTPTADRLAPRASITAGPANGAVVAELEPFVFTGFDNATPALRLGFECAIVETALGVDAATWQTCTSPYSAGGLEPGDYTFAVRAVDLANNAGAAATRTFTVAGAPVVTIVSGPQGRLHPITGEAALPYSSTENAIFTFKADQPGVTFECSLDGAEFVPCNTPSGSADSLYVHSFWIEVSGTHEVEVRGTNAQGIVGVEALYEWVVELGPDAVAPNTTITSGPVNGTLDTVATFGFTGSDNRTPAANLRFECALDSTTSWNSCVSPQQFSDLTRGRHTLHVRAIDVASNVDSTSNACTLPVTGAVISSRASCVRAAPHRSVRSKISARTSCSLLSTSCRKAFSACLGVIGRSRERIGVRSRPIFTPCLSSSRQIPAPPSWSCRWKRRRRSESPRRSACSGLRGQPR